MLCFQNHRFRRFKDFHSSNFLSGDHLDFQLNQTQKLFSKTIANKVVKMNLNGIRFVWPGKCIKVNVKSQIIATIINANEQIPMIRI